MELWCFNCSHLNSCSFERSLHQCLCSLCGMQLSPFEPDQTSRKKRRVSLEKPEGLGSQEEKKSLACSRCTFENSIYDARCEVCGHNILVQEGRTHVGFYLNRVSDKHGFPPTLSSSKERPEVYTSIPELVNTFSDLEEAWVCTMDVFSELEQFFQVFPALLNVQRLLFVHGMRDCQTEIEKTFRGLNANALCLCPEVPPYGTHHTKCFILFSPLYMRVIIHTANLINADLLFKSEAVFVEDFPSLANGTGASGKNEQFGRQLHKYFENVFDRSKKCLPNELANSLLAKLSQFDCSNASALLVASVPGVDLPVGDNFGLHCLHNHLHSSLSSEKKNWPVVLQFTSLGSQGKGEKPWLLDEFLIESTGVSKGIKREVYIIYPSEENCKNSVFNSSNGLFLTSKDYSRVKDKFCSWQANPTHPSHADTIPHMKSYCSFNPANPRELGWCCVTSANGSKAAWGTKTRKGTLHCRSFELGVLFTPELLDGKERKVYVTVGSGAYGEVVLPVPYELPPLRYKSGDKPGPLGSYPVKDLRDC